MFLLYCYLRNRLRYIVRHLNYCESPYYKGGRLYKSVSKNDKKGKIRVYKELRQLAKYWHCYPDTYFRFGMFLKDFGDMDLMKTFVPQDAYYRYSAAKDSKYNILIDDKILFHDIMQVHGISVPERYFIIRNQQFYHNGNRITDEDVNAILKSINDERIYIKRYRGGGGSGISIAIKKNDGYYTMNGDKLSADSIRKLYHDSNYIFEKQIIQDEIIGHFNPDSVNTIRILTYKDKCVSAAIRFGGKGDFVDNVSKGGAAVSVDLETGVLGDWGVRLYDVNKYYEHPDSHIRFKGTQIPHWDSILNLAYKFIETQPYYNSVGLDIALTTHGPVLVEVNTGAGVNLSQMGKAKGLADKFKS